METGQIAGRTPSSPNVRAVQAVCLWAAPEPEALEQDFLAYYQAMQKRKKKTA